MRGALLATVASLAAGVAALATIPGAPPALDPPSPGCAFAPRCPFKIERCEVERPEFFSIGVGHRAACHLTASGAVAP